MKIDKSTHMLILGAFVLVFVIIYLYIAITDIKRLKIEVQVLQKDLTTLLDSTKCILPKQEGVAVQAQCEFLPLPVLTPVQSMNQKVETPTPILDEEEDDEEESIDADEIKMMINEDDDDEEEEEIVEEDEEVEEMEEVQEEEEVETVVEEIATDTPTIDSIRKMKYEEIKDLCRKKGISIKGTKEQLIEKLSA
jgi:hypothetical protein